MVVDWSMVDKEDYLLAMERSPIRDIEIKHVLKNALTDEIDSREVYMKGIDHSYYTRGIPHIKQRNCNTTCKGRGFFHALFLQTLSVEHRVQSLYHLNTHTKNFTPHYCKILYHKNESI